MSATKHKEMETKLSLGGGIRFAIVGCGYVADYYMQMLGHYSDAHVVRALDIHPEHASRFKDFWGVGVVGTMEDFLAGLDCDLVLNLTNPYSHFEVTKACLQAGFSVYSEKPLAMAFAEIQTLAGIAEANGLTLASAPCNHIGEAAQAVKRALTQKRIGTPLVAYAEMDDKLIAKAPYRDWRSVSGAPWPYSDEFRVGCTLEHAGYYLTWLVFLFGPVEQVTAFASLQNPGKPAGNGAEAADFSVAVLKFKSGMAARLTCSVLAPIDRGLRIYGDEGELRAEDAWFYQTPVTYRRWMRIRRGFRLSPWKNKVPLEPTPVPRRRRSSLGMDYIRGPIEVVQAAREGRRSRLPMDFCIHFNEIALAICDSATRSGPYKVQSTCVPPAPLPSRHDTDLVPGFLDRMVPPVLNRLFKR
jgi:predicted dehydrogenase